jgi:hypothetical protein
VPSPDVQGYLKTCTLGLHECSEGFPIFPSLNQSASPDLLSIIDRAGRKGWRLVLLDLAIDTSTPQGMLFLSIVGAMAEFESRLCGERQKETHAERRARGQTWGKDCGKVTAIHPPVLAIPFS